MCYLSLVEHHDAVRGEHGVEAVGDGQGGAVLKRCPDGLLDQSVRLRVHGCCRLVQNQNLRPEPANQMTELRPQPYNQTTGSWGGGLTRLCLSDLSISHLALPQQSSGDTQHLSLSH